MIWEDMCISKLLSALTEQLQEKDEIIRMNQSKILELSKKHNSEVKEAKEPQEVLAKTKMKA